MYIIKSDTRNAYMTATGWTTIERDGKNAALNGLGEVVRFTKNEMLRNKDTLPKGQRFVHFPKITWRDIK